MSRNRRLLFVIACATVSVAGARADIFINLDNPDQVGAAGSTLQFFGTINNTGADTVYLNGDGLNLIAASGDFTANDLFFANVPLSVAGGSSSGDIELFDLTVDSPFSDAFATYSGAYTLLGGVDGNAQDVLGETGFSATVTPGTVGATPEPRMGMLVLVLGGFMAIAAWRRRKRSPPHAA